jgi:hypothetical protein
MSIHSSSANSLAELRFSGSHCSIFRTTLKKHTLPLFSLKGCFPVFKRCRFWNRNSRAKLTFKCVVTFEHRPPGTTELTISREKLAPQIPPGREGLVAEAQGGLSFQQGGPGLDMSRARDLGR